MMTPATTKQVRLDYKRHGYDVRIAKSDGHIRFRAPGGEWCEGRYVSEHRVDERGRVHLIYTVSTITTDANGDLAVGAEKVFVSKLSAFAAAKRLAGGRAKFGVYGPSSVAYVGSTVTAVVAASAAY